jgi:shikimate dehydrogenase
VEHRDQARLFGVLGDPVDHSLSPAMQNAAFAAAGLPHVYLRYRVPAAALPRALSEARALRMGGLNLTVPLKETVLPLLDAVTPAAGRIGAVNTILFDPDGRMRGDNTDGEGFLRALAGRVRVRGAQAVVIGAGGAARAVATALADAGCRAITIANRTMARAERLAERLERLAAATVAVVPLETLAGGDPLADAALVVNTTPLARFRVRWAASPARCVFVDLVYARLRTPFLAGAARARRATLDGSGMLLHQGALAFEAWTGRRAPRAAMARALRAAGLASPSLTHPNGAASFRLPRPPKEA